MDQPLLRSLTDTQRLLSIGRTTLFGLIRTGALPTVQIGRRTFVTHDDLTAYITRLKETK